MIKIYDLLSDNRTRKNVEVYGWVKTFRANRFISINDGKNLGELLCRDFLYWDTGILQTLRSNHSEKGT